MDDRDKASGKWEYLYICVTSLNLVIITVSNSTVLKLMCGRVDNSELL